VPEVDVGDDYQRALLTELVRRAVR
jgi:hypothetical protein